MSSALRAEAVAAGVPAHRIDARVAKLRLIYIGGRNGVRDRDGYVRGCFEQWAKWEADNAAKEATRNGLTARAHYWGGAGSWEVSRKMRAYATKWELDVDELARVFVESGACDKAGNAEQADRVFIRRLVDAARAKSNTEPMEAAKPTERQRRSGAA
jgi:hypothetical protein